MFGLGVDERKTINLIRPTQLTLGSGQVVFITGASGGGKSTLLRLIGEQLCQRNDTNVIDFDALGDADDGPLVETIGGTLEEATRWLALAGLNDAFVMLRRPGELSDGQRYRFRLARAMAASERAGASLTVALADEFASTLDRLTAMVIGRNVRKWTRRSGVCFIAATAHDDLLESLEPDTLVVQHPGEELQVMARDGGT